MSATGGIVPAIRHDLRTLLAGWRNVVFPRQLDPHPVSGPWRPSTLVEHLAFWGWTILGIPLIAVFYPLAILGFATRYIARKLDWAAGALGLLTVIGIAAVLWGVLTLIAWFRFPTTGFFAVLAASIVAIVSAGLAWVFHTYGGRTITVALAYPFGVAAVFLPPVTAAIFSPTIGDLILPESHSLAVWLLDNVLSVQGIDDILRREFDLTELGYLLMWFGIAFPVGWLLGILATIANAIRRSDEDEQT